MDSLDGITVELPPTIELPPPPTIDTKDLYGVIGVLYATNAALQQHIADLRAAVAAHRCSPGDDTPR